jgi:hypothetical protein
MPLTTDTGNILPSLMLKPVKDIISNIIPITMPAAFITSKLNPVAMAIADMALSGWTGIVILKYLADTT